MTDLKTRLYRRVRGRDGHPSGRLDASWIELVWFLWRSGGAARVRGALSSWRLGSCGGRFFLGRRTRLVFAGHIHAGRDVLIGDDCYVNGYAERGVRLGNHVRIREGGWIQATSTLDQPGVGLVIGEHSYIGPRCLLGAGGGITIGRHVTFGAGVHVLAENHVFADAARLIEDQGVTRAGVTIEDDVWIGNQAVVLDGVRVGRGAVVGAGAVVTRDLPEYAVATGNPARVISYRTRARS